MFTSNLFKMIVANSLPPLIIFLATPFILAANKEYYGQYAVASALAAVIAVFASGRYEQLLPLLKKENRPRFIRKAFITLSAITIASGAFSMLLHKFGYISRYIALALPFLIFGQGIYQITYYKLLADHNFLNLNLSKLTQSIIMLVGQVGFPGSAGLWISEAASRSFMWIFATRQSGRAGANTKGDNERQLSDIETTTTRRGFIVGSILSAAAVQVPLLTVSTLMDTTDLSIYSAIDRMVHLPLLLISTTIGQYFFANSNRAALLVKKPVIRYSFITAYSLLILIALTYWHYKIPGFGLSLGWLILIASGFFIESGAIILNQIASATRPVKLYRGLEIIRFTSLTVCCTASAALFGVWSVPIGYSIAALLSTCLSYLSIHRGDPFTKGEGNAAASS